MMQNTSVQVMSCCIGRVRLVMHLAHHTSSCALVPCGDGPNPDTRFKRETHVAVGRDATRQQIGNVIDRDSHHACKPHTTTACAAADQPTNCTTGAHAHTHTHQYILQQVRKLQTSNLDNRAFLRLCIAIQL